MTVGVNPPRTPVTEGSNGIAAATIPNVCKMPGPPAPFVPTPLPNIGKSGNSPQGYSTTVKIEGNAVAIKGATFNSMGDVASQGTGGGLISSNVQGPTSFVAPGSLDVTIEGKAVQLLGDQMLNNCAAGGNPPNSATMNGTLQGMAPPASTLPPYESKIDCEENKKPPPKGKGWDDCVEKQLCAKVKEVNSLRKDNVLFRKDQSTDPAYAKTKAAYYSVFETARNAKTSMSEAWLKSAFYHPCAKERYDEGGRVSPPNQKSLGRAAFQADHIHDSQLGCNLENICNFKMLSQSVNGAIGPSLQGYDPQVHGVVTLPNCDCSK